MPGMSDQDVLFGIADRARGGEHDFNEQVEGVSEREAVAVAREGQCDRRAGDAVVKGVWGE